MIQQADKTRHNQTDSPLSPQKEKALAGLLAGQTVAAAAKAASVARCTVHAWLKDDCDFQAALYQGRRELRAAARARLLALSERSVKALERALVKGNARVAIEILKGLGLMNGPADGPDDAAALQREQQRFQKMQAHMEDEQERSFPYGSYHNYDPLL